MHEVDETLVHAVGNVGRTDLDKRFDGRVVVGKAHVAHESKRYAAANFQHFFPVLAMTNGRRGVPATHSAIV